MKRLFRYWQEKIIYHFCVRPAGKAIEQGLRQGIEQYNENQARKKASEDNAG